MPQYKILIKTSRGAEHSESVFLIKNNFGDNVRSARRPKMNVAIAILSPMMVKYCQCQPYESFIMVGQSMRYL